MPRTAAVPVRRPSRPHLIYGGVALTILVISAVLTARARAAPAEPEPARFSGSNVVLRMPSLLSRRPLQSRLPVAIVRDDAAAEYYDSPATLDTIVRAWRDALTAAGADARVVRPSQLRGSAAKVIVVPSSPCLTLATREAIETAGARGQGLVLTGAVGTHDAGCRQLGYGLLIGLTGASRAEPLADRPMVYVTIPGDSPLAADIPPGARLNVSPAGQLALRTPVRDAFYSDYTLGALPARGEPYFDGAIVRSSYRGARVVYLGFELRDVVRSAWSGALLRLLARNAVAWTADLPLASLESWPDGRASAAVIAQDVEQGFENARHALDSLKAAGIRSTYFLTSSIALRNRRLVRRLSAAGEIGTHSENHSLLGGTPLARQVERLRTTQRELTDLLDAPARGLRPPEEQFDKATMAAWLAAGGTYLLGANDSRCAAPELLPVDGDTLLLVPRVFADDIAAAGPGWRRPPDRVGALLRGEVDKARAVGGLFVLSYHSQLLAREEYVPALASVARYIASDTATWVTTADAVAEWWRARAGVELRVSRRAGALDVTIVNPAPQVVENAVVRVVLPGGARVRNASAPLLVSDDPGVARLLVRFIPGRSSTRLRIALS